MKRFLDYQSLNLESLEEKLILYNSGKKYGQIVFLAGGAGSGKGFAAKNFMEYEKFKVRDVDAWKEAFLKLAKTMDKYEELRNLKLGYPADVFKLHTFVKEKGIQDKSMDLLLGNMKNPEILPNIIFDVTLKDLDDLNSIVPKLLEVGYKARDIHVTWVLTDYSVAVSRNKNRERIVPDDILLKTHEGAALSMNAILKKKIPNGVDGEIRVILNNGAVFYADDKGNALKNGKGGKNMTVKDFDYLTVKKSGKSPESSGDLTKTLNNWINNNIPKSKATSGILPSDV